MPAWLGLAGLIGVQIAYPLVTGETRAALVVATVVLGWALSVWHALQTRGPRVAGILVAVSTGGGLLVEAVGVRTGFPFGAYGYGDALGAKLFGVPLIIPLAWTWMAWPAWLVAANLAQGRAARIGLAGAGLAAWDLFLDPQMVAEHYWRWQDPSPALPGVADVPVGNYVGWLVVALAMMTLLTFATSRTAPLTFATSRTAPLTAATSDGPMLAMYLWTYYSSVLAHAVFLRLPGSAVWGGFGMGLVAAPLTAHLWKRRLGTAGLGPVRLPRR